MTSVRAAAVQAPAVAFDTAASVAAAEHWITQASRDGATLIVLPEGFLGGYPRGADFGATVGARTAEGRGLFARYLAAAVRVPGPETDRLCRAAARHRRELVVGVIERVGWTLYCSAVFISDTGELRGVHRKLQPTGSERLIWGQGDGSTLCVFDVFQLAVDRTERRPVAFHAHPDGATAAGFTGATATGGRPLARPGLEPNLDPDLDTDSARSTP